jgi:hypothetical protein
MMFQGAAAGRTTESPICNELTLDQLLADPIVRQLMRRDRVDEPGVRSLVREVSATRSTLRNVDHPDRGEENDTARLLVCYRSGEVTPSEQYRSLDLA